MITVLHTFAEDDKRARVEIYSGTRFRAVRLIRRDGAIMVEMLRTTLKWTDRKREEQCTLTLADLQLASASYRFFDHVDECLEAALRHAGSDAKVPLLTVALGHGAFRVCLATTDPNLAIKIGYGNEDEYSTWQELTDDGKIMSRDGVRIPRMRLLDRGEYGWHPEHTVTGDRKRRCDAAESQRQRAIAVERVQGKTLASFPGHSWSCNHMDMCAKVCVERRVREAFPEVIDIHPGNIMIGKDNSIWLVDIAC